MRDRAIAGEEISMSKCHDDECNRLAAEFDALEKTQRRQFILSMVYLLVGGAFMVCGIVLLLGEILTASPRIWLMVLGALSFVAVFGANRESQKLISDRSILDQMERVADALGTIGNSCPRHNADETCEP
jgi:hypothetical protein